VETVKNRAKILAEEKGKRKKSDDFIEIPITHKRGRRSRK